MPEKEFKRLVEIMEKLRSEKGCPWDREQTAASLRQYLLEETYEVLEAIDKAQYDNLMKELGDLLLQVVFQAQIAKEEGRFDIKDVLTAINEKLIRRHPHVFGNAQIKTSQEQSIHWEQLKIKEGKQSALDGVPKELPALVRAYRIQSKAAHVGFDWDNVTEVWTKVEEELEEFKEAIKTDDTTLIEEELGDLLFSLVNLSRFIRVNPEDCLRRTINKFIKRFQTIEQTLALEGKKLPDVSLEEMDEIWNAIKHTIDD